MGLTTLKDWFPVATMHPAVIRKESKRERGGVTLFHGSKGQDRDGPWKKHMKYHLTGRKTECKATLRTKQYAVTITKY